MISGTGELTMDKPKPCPFCGGMEWISVKDRLPRIGDEVIVSVKDDSGDSPYWYTTVGWYACDHNRWIVDNEFNTMVTHWAALPRACKEG